MLTWCVRVRVQVRSDQTVRQPSRWRLARNTAAQLGRSHLPHLAATIAVVAYFAGQLETNAVFYWGGVALANNVRAAVCNRADGVSLQRGQLPRWYRQLNASYYLTYGAIWGSLPVVAGRYGSGSDVWVGFVVLLAMVGLTAVVTASSRLFFTAMLSGAFVATSFGALIDATPGNAFAVLLLLYFAAALWLHQAFRQTLTALIVSDLENRQLVDRLTQVLEYQDPLTRLLNRDGLAAAARELVRPLHRGRRLAVAVGNVQRLSAINELFGIEQGDAVLALIARRLEDVAEPGAALCRLSGDEFAIAAQVDAGSDGSHLRDVLERCMFEPFVLDGRSMPIRMSTAAKVGDPAKFEQLVVGASSLVREERSQRSPTLTVADGAIHERREMLSELHAGLAAGEVTPWFQPIVACDGSRVEGWEALVRWEHPVRGLVPPLQFLGVAEVGGIMTELTTRVIEASFQFVAELTLRGHHGAASVHVNLTASEARRSETPRFFQHCLATYSVNPAAITIEITEQEVTRIEGDLLGNLQLLESMGFGLAIDDFGTGYSSLSHLLDLRATELKIDKRFIDGLPHDRASTELVRAVLGLARGLGMRTVAEGVETADQLAFLAGAGCEMYQGYLTSPALRPGEAITFLTRHVASTPQA